MKKDIVILLIVIFCVSFVNAQEEVKWYSIDEAMELAIQEPRVLVIDVYTYWCGWCKRMEATTFSDPVIAQYLNENFYPVKLNAEGKEDIVLGDKTFKFVDNGRRGYHEIAAIVTKGRLSFPTISYVDHSGKVLEAFPGYKTVDQFEVDLAFFQTEAYKTKTLKEFSESYTSNLLP